MNKHVEWVYGVKVVGILAVILGHIDSPFSSFIFSWHMPLFFIISGFFIKVEENLKDLIIKDWKRLMLPYFTFAAVAIIAESIKRLLLHRESLVYLEELKGVLFWMDMEHLINSYAFVLWFLPALFFARFFYYLIKKSVSNLLYQLCISVCLFIASFHVQLPFAFANAMNSVLWIFIGSILYKQLHGCYKGIWDKFRIDYAVCSSAVIIALIYWYIGVPSLNVSLLEYGDKILNVLWAVSVVIVLISFFKALANRYQTSKLLKQWGGETMVLFIFHTYTNNIAHILVEKVNVGGWPLKLAISLCLLQVILFIKSHINHWWFFRYV